MEPSSDFSLTTSSFHRQKSSSASAFQSSLVFRLSLLGYHLSPLRECVLQHCAEQDAEGNGQASSSSATEWIGFLEDLFEKQLQWQRHSTTSEDRKEEERGYRTDTENAQKEEKERYKITSEWAKNRLKGESSSYFRWPVFEMAEYEAIREDEDLDLETVCIITNLPEESCEYLKKGLNILLQFLDVVSLHIPTNSKGIAFVEFISHESAKVAVDALHGLQWSYNSGPSILARMFVDYSNCANGFSDLSVPWQSEGSNNNETYEETEEEGEEEEEVEELEVVEEEELEEQEESRTTQTVAEEHPESFDESNVCINTSQEEPMDSDNLPNFSDASTSSFLQNQQLIDPLDIGCSRRRLLTNVSSTRISAEMGDISDVSESLSSDTETGEGYITLNEDQDDSEEEDDFTETHPEQYTSQQSMSGSRHNFSELTRGFGDVLKELNMYMKDKAEISLESNQESESRSENRTRNDSSMDSDMNVWTKYQEDLLNRNRVINMQFLHAQDQILRLQQENFHFRKDISTAQLERDTAKLEAQNLAQHIEALELRTEKQNNLLKEFYKLRRDLGASEMKMCEMADSLAKNEIIAAHLRTRLQRMTGNEIAGLEIEDFSHLESLLLQSLDRIRAAKDKRVLENQQKLTRKAEAQDEVNLCVVCLAKDKSIVCLPCRHYCLCKSCSSHSEMKRCPVCRNDIRKLLSVYT